MAVVTGASTGIGRELARCAAADGCDLVICADEAAIHVVAQELQASGTSVTAVEADLGTPEGVDALFAAIGDRRIDYMMANAGRGIGGAFLDQSEADILEVVRVNVIGTTDLLHRTVRRMRAAGTGRILITDTMFFYRAQMLDTPIGRTDDKDDPASVAQEGYAAMMDGRSGVTAGFMNKVQSLVSGLIPDSVLAAMHRNGAKPDGGADHV